MPWLGRLGAQADHRQKTRVNFPCGKRGQINSVHEGIELALCADDLINFNLSRLLLGLAM